jgi:hypothetical protein
MMTPSETGGCEEVLLFRAPKADDTNILTTLIYTEKTR